jgi:hypothetical protein
LREKQGDYDTTIGEEERGFLVDLALSLSLGYYLFFAYVKVSYVSYPEEERGVSCKKMFCIVFPM